MRFVYVVFDSKAHGQRLQQAVHALSFHLNHSIK
jgi:hypothetical protein